MNSNFQVIAQDEYDDFITICKSNGFEPDDFNLTEHDISWPKAGSVGPVKGKLTISKNGNSKTYNTGHGSSWPSQFESDLIHRSF